MFTFCFSLIIAISSTSCNNVVKQNKVVTNKVDPSVLVTKNLIMIAFLLRIRVFSLKTTH